MKVRPFHVFAALSLVPLCTLAAAWARTWLPEDFRWGMVDGTAVLVLSRGEYTETTDRMYFSTGPQRPAPGGGYYPSGIGLRGFLNRLRPAREPRSVPRVRRGTGR